MHRGCLGVLLAGLVAAIAGCGGSSNSGLNASTFSNAAGKLCASTEAQIKSLGQLSPNGTHTDAANLDKADAVIMNVIKKFNALHGPNALNAARDKFVNDLNLLESDLSSASSLAKAGDTAGYASALRSASALQATGTSDGTKLGAKACASSS